MEPNAFIVLLLCILKIMFFKVHKKKTNKKLTSNLALHYHLKRNYIPMLFLYYKFQARLRENTLRRQRPGVGRPDGIIL